MDQAWQTSLRVGGGIGVEVHLLLFPSSASLSVWITQNDPYTQSKTGNNLVCAT